MITLRATTSRIDAMANRTSSEAARIAQTRTDTASTRELINITIRKQVEITMIRGPMIDATQILINSRTMIITTSITETTFTAVETLMMVDGTTRMTRVSGTKEIARAFCNVSSRN